MLKSKPHTNGPVDVAAATPKLVTEVRPNDVLLGKGILAQLPVYF